MIAIPKGSMLYIRIWVRQTCTACGAQFRYLCRTAVPESRIEPGASVEGVEGYYAKFETAGTRYCPCPQCGWVQPSMIGGQLDADATISTILGVMALLGNAAVAAFGLVDREVSMGVAVIVCGYLGWVYLWGTVSNPNRLRRDNLEVARKEVKRGRLQLLHRGDLPGPPGPWPNTLGPLVIGQLLSGGAAAASLASFSPLVPLWASLIGGLVLIVAAGWTVAAVGAKWMTLADGAAIDEVVSTVATGKEIPEDFEDIVTSPGQYKADWPTW